MASTPALPSPLPTRCYRLMRRGEWEEFVASGVYAGSPLDHRDGYLHMSQADQVRVRSGLWWGLGWAKKRSGTPPFRAQVLPTANKYYAGTTDLVAVVVDLSRLPRVDTPPATDATVPDTGVVVWEWVEGRGTWFPHLYGAALRMDAVERVVDVVWTPAAEGAGSFSVDL